MDKKLNEQAWALLLDDEKMALSLQYGLQKSSWQAGEMMDKSHYKYLEIKYRAETFLKLFTEHFQYFDTIIPEGISGPEVIKEYFRLCIGERKKLPEVSEILKQKFRVKESTQRENLIKKQMEEWRTSESLSENVFYNLIKEFDRWNNFRILPANLQEPSAFKRRNKKVQLKHIRVTTKVPDISISKIQSILCVSKPQQPKMYMPIITENREIHIMELRKVKTVMEQVTTLNLYIFKDKNLAQEYINLLYTYTKPVKKSCNEGLQFWPKYRDIVRRAENFETIQNIVPSRRFLVMALNKLQFF